MGYVKGGTYRVGFCCPCLDVQCYLVDHCSYQPEFEDFSSKVAQRTQHPRLARTEEMLSLPFQIKCCEAFRDMICVWKLKTHAPSLCPVSYILKFHPLRLTLTLYLAHPLSYYEIFLAVGILKQFHHIAIRCCQLG